jgi:two-component system, LuxR family, response regulator FixJ
MSLDAMQTSDEVYIVDDDYDMREVLAAILRNAGFRTAAFTDGRSFIRLARDQNPACVLLDLHMPGPSGLDVLKEIDARNYSAPILILSGREDILNVVTAMRNGAFDYLEKRLDANVIVARVFEAIEAWKQFREREEKPQIISPAIRNYYQLTRREREVLAHIAAAASNKETGRNLGISPRTVEIHRGRIMHKLGAKNSVDLMRIVMNTRQSRDEHAAPAQTAAP